MLCEKQNYKLPVFCTFNRAVGLNYTTDKQGAKKPITDADGQPLPRVGINKGEKSFPVMLTTFTVVDKDTKEKINYEDYKRLSNDEKAQYNVYPKLNVYQVFNVDQTNLKEARPDLYAKLESENKLQRPFSGEGESFKFPAMDAMIGFALSTWCTRTTLTSRFPRTKLRCLKSHSSRMANRFTAQPFMK